MMIRDMFEYQTLVGQSHSTAADINEAVDDGFDLMARVSRKTNSTITEIGIVDTNNFLARLSVVQAGWRSDISALREVVEWQHRVIDFNSSYVAYLLEQISEEEFESVAESSVVDEVDKDKYQVASMIDRVLRLTNLDYTASDFSNMLACSQEAVVEALEFLADKYPKVQLMLSESRE
jgi:hypothetical protein